MDSNYNMLDIMRLRTQLAVPECGGNSLSRSEHERAPTLYPPASYSSMNVTKSGLEASLPVKTCGGGESYLGSMDALRRPNGQVDSAAIRQHTTSAQFASMSRDEESACGPQYTKETLLPGGVNRSGAVAPTPAHQLTRQGWPSNSRTNMSTSGGDWLCPAMPRGWSVAPSDPTQLSTSSQMDLAHGSTTGSDAVAPHGHCSSSCITGVANAADPSSIVGQRSLDVRSSLEAFRGSTQSQAAPLQQPQQCPSQQQDEMVTLDGLLLNQQRHNQLNQHLSAAHQVQVLGTVNRQQQQISRPQATRSSVASQHLQYTCQVEGRGSLQQQEALPAQLLIAQTQMQGNLNVGDLKAHLAVADLSAGMHGQAGPQFQMAAHMQIQQLSRTSSLQQFRPEHQQQAGIGGQAVMAFEPQQYPRSLMLSCLVPNMDQMAGVPNSFYQAHASLAQPSSTLLQSSTMHIQSDEGRRQPPGDCTNGALGNACKEPLSMCAGKEHQQLGQQIQAAMQGLPTQSGLQPHIGQQVGPLDPKASLMRLDSQAMQMQPGLQVTPLQLSQQMQPADERVGSQAGSQFPEASNNYLYRQGSVRCQEPWNPQLEQVHYTSNANGQKRLWDQQSQSDLEHKRMQLEQHHQLDSQHPKNQTKTTTVSMSHQQQQQILYQRRQSQLFLQQQQQEQDQRRQEEQRQRQPFVMMGSHPDWQQTQPCAQPVTTAGWATYQYSTGGADPSLVAATKQRQQQQFLPGLEQIQGQHLQGGQCTQGNIGGLPVEDAEAKHLGQGPEQNILQSCVQSQIQQLIQQQQRQWQAELHEKQQQAAQQQQYAHQQDQPASPHADNGYRSCAAEVQQNRAPSVGGASRLQRSSLGVNKAPSGAVPMQQMVQAPTILANVQQAMHVDMCMPGAPLPSFSLHQSSACLAPSSGAPPSLLPSAPGNQVPQPSTVAVSSGNSSVQQLRQQTQHPWVATVSPAQQLQLPVSSHDSEQRQLNGDSMIAPGNVFRSNELNGGVLDPQTLQRPLFMPHQRKHQDAGVGNPSHNAQYLTQSRHQTGIRIQPPIPDGQPGQQQHQLSGQDSCATPDGASQEEVEAVARGASNPFPHASVAMHAAVAGSIRTGAVALPHGIEALQQPPQQQNQSGVCLSSAACVNGQHQQGAEALQQEPQQQLLQELNLLQRGAQDVSLRNCQSAQGDDQRQVWMQQQQQLKTCQATQASSLPSELLQGRPLLPLFKPAQDNGGHRIDHAHQQQHQHPQMLLGDLGGCASSPAVSMPEQHLMGACMLDHVSKKGTATQVNVVQSDQFKLSQQRQEQQLQQQQQHEAQRQQQIIQYQEKQQLQQMFMQPAPQSVAAAAARPTELRAGVTATSAKGNLDVHVDSPLVGTDEAGLVAFQEHHVHLLQQHQKRHQDRKPPAQLSLNMQSMTQSARQGMFSYSAGASTPWALQCAPFSRPGGGNSLAEATTANDATTPGIVRQPAFGFVSTDILNGGYPANGQPLGMQFPQQQRVQLQERLQRSHEHVIPGQEHMAPRPQSSCSALSQLQPHAAQQQQQQQWQHFNIHQQQRAQDKLQQQLQASATANLPGAAPQFERRSWASMPNATSAASGNLASSAAGGPAPNQLGSGQSAAQFASAGYVPNGVPAINGTSALITGPWAGCNVTGGGQGSSGSCAAGVERPYKRMKRESDNCAATLQPCSMATPWLDETAGAIPLSDENKAAVAAALEAVDRLIAPLPVHRTSPEWAAPPVLCPVPGYESSSETKPESVRKATVPRSAYGQSQPSQHHQHHPQLALLEQQHHLRLQQQHQLLGQRRRQSHITGRRSQGGSGGGHMAAAAAPSTLPALPPLPPPTHLTPLPFAHAAPPAPTAAHVVSHDLKWSLEESPTGTPQATSSPLPVTPPPALVRRQLQSLSRKATTTVDDSCARARPIDLSNLGQHRLKAPPVIHPLRPGSRFPLVAAGLRGGAVGLQGSVAPGASPIVGAVTEDTASGVNLVADGAVATAVCGNVRRKRLAVKDRKVPVELLPVVGKAVGAGAGGVRLKRGKTGGHGSGVGQSTAPGKLLNALREAKALLNRRFVVRRSSIAQLGVFAAERIPADTLLMEYHGEAVRNTVADLREKRYAAAGLGCYLFNPGGPPDEAVVLDATHRGNIMRFVNHSCGPNCTAKTVVVEGQRRIFLFSSTALLPGTELTYDYKLSSALCMDAFKGLPEEYIEQAAEQIGVELLRCQCGDKRCRKYL